MFPALAQHPAPMAEAARGFSGRPYLFKGCTESMDNFGLIRACVAKVTGADLETVPDVARETPDWTEAVTYSVCARWLRDMGMHRVPVAQARPGDVLIFRMGETTAGVHVAVLTETDGPEWQMVHAYWARAVITSWAGRWMDRLVAAYRLDPAPAMRRAA